MVAIQLGALLLWSVLDLTAAGFYSFDANQPNYPYASIENIPLMQNNVYSFLQTPQLPVSLMQGTGYNQLSTCVYINLKNPIRILQEFPLLSYLAGDTPTAELVLQLESEFQTSSIYIGGNNKATFPTFPSPNQWTHVCITWDGTLGHVSVYVDGQSIGVHQGIQAGYQIPANGIWSVGQAQPQVGHVTQLQVWDKIISEFEVAQVQSCSLSGNILSWDPNSMELTVFDANVGDPCAPVTETESCLEFPSTSPLDQDYLPEEMLNYYVEGVFDKDLPRQKQFSVCAWLYIEEGVDMYPLFVYDRDGLEIFSLYISWDGVFGLALGDEGDHAYATISSLKIKYNDWQHYCIAWSGHNGKIQIFVNGDLQHGIRDFMTGYSLPAGSGLWVYQVQYESAYYDEPTEGFALKTTDVNWWNLLIKEEEAEQVYSCPGSLPSNIINWNDDALQLYDFWLEEEETGEEEEGEEEEGEEEEGEETEEDGGMSCFGPVTQSPMDSEDPIVLTKPLVKQTASNTLPEVPTQFSICFWVYHDHAVCQITENIIYLGFSSINVCSGSITSSGSRGFTAAIDGWSWYSAISADWKAWTHFCFTRVLDGQLKLYKNGILVKETPDPFQGGILKAGDLSLVQVQLEVRDVNDPIKGFLSKITDFNMWDRVIDETEAFQSFCTGGVVGNVANPATEWKPLTYEPSEF